MNKINKQALHPKNNGWYVHEVYSRTDKSDETGRWARNIYYNGLIVAYVGTVPSRVLPNKKPSKFCVDLRFPIGTNQFKITNTYHEAEAYAKEMFEDFLRVVNNPPKKE